MEKRRAPRGKGTRRNPRRRHVQQPLVFHRRGGSRKGAGRKRIAPRKRVPHRRRPEVRLEHPLHVTLRVLECVGRLRRREIYHALRKAMLVVAPREDFRIVHLSIQGNHVHLICEADNKKALAEGVKAFKTSAGRKINRALGRKGTVFADRYHAVALTSPTQVRNALAYVLNNFRRHGEDRGLDWRIDWFSSACSFDGWIEPSVPVPVGYEQLPVASPRSWLLRVGWQRGAGGAISMFEVPGRPC